MLTLAIAVVVVTFLACFFARDLKYRAIPLALVPELLSLVVGDRPFLQYVISILLLWGGLELIF